MDIKVNSNNNINFGWFDGTHKRLTRFALENLPNLKPYKDKLEIFSIKPDFDENRRFNNLHFFSPVQKRSFLDFHGKDNACAKYKEHVIKMLSAINKKEIDLFIEHAGRALHYLQDMTQPQHTQKGLLFNKILHFRLHLDFEKFVRENYSDCFIGYEEIPFRNRSFDDLFLENMNLSTKSELPTRKDTYLWEYIARKGVNQAIASTKEFLTKVSKLLDDANQYKLPFTDLQEI